MSLIASSQKELADTIGIGERTYATWLREGCPGEVKNYVVCDVIEWAKDNKWNSDSDETLLDSIDDDDLKRELIKERISKLQRENRLADFKIGERDENLVDVSVIRSILMEHAERVRSAINTVEKKHGSDSCSPIREAMESTRAGIKVGIFDSNGDG